MDESKLKIVPSLMDSIAAIKNLEKVGLGDISPQVYRGPSAVGGVPNLVPQGLNPAEYPALFESGAPQVRDTSLTGRIEGGLEKVNRVLEGTPILGHVLRSTKAELQERDLPARMGRAKAQAGQQAQMAQWEAMQDYFGKVDAAAIGAQGRKEAAGITAGAQRDKATMNMIADVVEMRDLAGDDSKDLFGQILKKHGFEIDPEQPDGGLVQWLMGLQKGRLGKLLRSLKGTGGGSSRPPLSSFQR